MSVEIEKPESGGWTDLNEMGFVEQEEEEEEGT